MAGVVTFDEFAAAITGAAMVLRETLHEVGEQIAEDLKAHAKAKFGTYQPGIGPYQDWPQLAESTKAERVSKGFSENDPLLRTGKLRDSIDTKVRREGLSIVVDLFSTDELMVIHEYGSNDGKIPPRPVIGPTVLERAPIYEQVTGFGAMASLIPARIRPQFGAGGHFKSIGKLLRLGQNG